MRAVVYHVGQRDQGDVVPSEGGEGTRAQDAKGPLKGLGGEQRWVHPISNHFEEGLVSRVQVHAVPLD